MKISSNKAIWIWPFLLHLGLAKVYSQTALRQVYICYQTLDSIEVDGRGIEPTWAKAPWSSTFIDIEGQEIPPYKTQFKMLWDDQYLYFWAVMEEPHVWGNLRQRDTVIFYNNDFEIFIDPDGDTHNYYEFEMNALNTVWDLLLTKPYRNGGIVLNAWDIQGLKTAVHIDGTLNDPTDLDQGWSVEVAIPWKVLFEASGSKTIPTDNFWRINFSRVNWTYELIDGKYHRKKDSAGKYLPEFNWVWSPQYKINMHQPEYWGYVYFSTDEPQEGQEFELPKDEHIKWYLYEVYKEIRKAEANGEKLKSVLPGQQEVLGQDISVQLSENAFGWHLWVRSPFSAKTLSIDKQGKFNSR